MTDHRPNWPRQSGGMTPGPPFFRSATQAFAALTRPKRARILEACAWPFTIETTNRLDANLKSLLSSRAIAAICHEENPLPFA